MSTFSPSQSSCFSLLLLVSLAGCARENEEAMAEAAVSSALSAHESGEVAKEVAEPGDSACSFDPEGFALTLARRRSAAFMPSSCVEKTADGNTLHVELNECSGRFGRSRIDGGLDAVLTATPECAVHAEIEDSGDLVANGHPFDYSAVADAEHMDGYDAIAWQAEWSGTTRRGRSIHQVTELDLTSVETGCVTADGRAQGDVDGIDYEIAIDGLAVCPDQCPTAGTLHAAVDGPRRERSLTVTFDGSAAAHVVGWTGREFDVEMECAAAE